MLSEIGLPKYFWTEAINTAYPILNRVSIRAILKRTPYELYYERKPNFSYFHIFGCTCFVSNNRKDNLEK